MDFVLKKGAFVSPITKELLVNMPFKIKKKLIAILYVLEYVHRNVHLLSHHAICLVPKIVSLNVCHNHDLK
jgi:hypothetical protein